MRFIKSQLVKILASIVISFIALLSLTYFATFESTVYLIGYMAFQFIALGTIWNLLFGKMNYINFGVVAFYGIGAYITSYLVLNFMGSFSLGTFLLFLIIGGLAAAALGMIIGIATMKMRGIYFAIATLALAMVTMGIVQNLDALGGATGLYIVRPEAPLFFSSFIEFLFAVMGGIALLTLAISWFIDSSWIGDMLMAIGNDEDAAAAIGIPTFKIKFLVCVLTSFLFGLVGAPLGYYQTFLEPVSVFSIYVNINAVAIPLLGGTTIWFGPLVGALILTPLKEIVKVTIGSAFSNIIPGIIIVVVITLFPKGIVSSVKELWDKIS